MPLYTLLALVFVLVCCLYRRALALLGYRLLWRILPTPLDKEKAGVDRALICARYGRFDLSAYLMAGNPAGPYLLKDFARQAGILVEPDTKVLVDLTGEQLDLSHAMHEAALAGSWDEFRSLAAKSADLDGRIDHERKRLKWGIRPINGVDEVR